MSKRTLSDKDRKTLLGKYKEDKLNDAPANISDKTLIENYGTDEQKTLLLASTPKAGTATKSETPTPNAAPTPSVANAGNENPNDIETEKVVNDGAGIVDDAERAHQFGEYFRVHGTQPNGDLLTQEIEALTLAKLKETENLGKFKDDDESQAYLAALNRYLELNNGQAPDPTFKLDQLKKANEAKEVELQNSGKQKAPSPLADDEQKFLGKPLPNLTNTITNKDVEKITLVNKEGKQKQFTKYTYETYMLNDKEWKPLPQVPIEVQNL